MGIITDITTRKRSERLLAFMNAASLAMARVRRIRSRLFATAGGELAAHRAEQHGVPGRPRRGFRAPGLLQPRCGDVAGRGAPAGQAGQGVRFRYRERRADPAGHAGTPGAAAGRGGGGPPGAARGAQAAGRRDRPGLEHALGHRGPAHRGGEGDRPAGGAFRRPGPAGRAGHHRLRQPDRRQLAEGPAHAGPGAQPARAAAHPGRADPGAENGGHRAAGRGDRPRLQQPAHGHRRLHPAPAGALSPDRTRRAPTWRRSRRPRARPGP